MIILMDRLFILIGFDAREIEASPIRGWLYAGMIFFAGFIFAFGIMILLS